MIEQWHAFLAWIGTSYEQAPALVLGLSVLLALPPLAMLGVLIRRSARASGEHTHLRTRAHSVPGTRVPRRALVTEREPAWPSQGWIVIEGSGHPGHRIDRSVVRIGREGDNDICLSDMTVHRYHAAIHRSDDAEFIITDLSSADGNGVTVNGQPVAEARLSDGDLIALGLARLRFTARPA